MIKPSLTTSRESGRRIQLTTLSSSAWSSSSFLTVVLVVLGTITVMRPSSCHGFRVASPSSRRDSRLKSQLLPEENPEFDPTARSLSGVSYSAVLGGLNQLFPPQELEQRNALSRTDGYWPYIRKGEDPPQALTYGEFDFYFFAQLLDRARTHLPTSTTADSEGWRDKVFVDIGSGTGRLVLAAAALHPDWRLCRGVELLPSIHKQAENNLEACRRHDDDSSSFALKTDLDGTLLPLAPVELVCGSLEGPYVYFGDADCIFVFSSCMSERIMTSLAAAIGRQCKPGTLVITTEFMLPLQGTIDSVENDNRVPSGSFTLGLVENLDGWCWLTGGESTAYIHRVVSSLWDPNRGPLQPPEISVEDKAFEVAMALESGKLTDSKTFLRGVYNNMIFHDLPPSLYPKIEED